MKWKIKMFQTTNQVSWVIFPYTSTKKKTEIQGGKISHKNRGISQLETYTKRSPEVKNKNLVLWSSHVVNSVIYIYIYIMITLRRFSQKSI